MRDFREWRIAYAKQALADLNTQEQLATTAKVPESQQLHFLQMACEKLCKAYLCGQGTDPIDLRKSHAHIERTLPMIARQQFARERHKSDHTWVLQALRKLARQIELLAPAVNDGGRHPANCEYPWVGPEGQIVVPAEHKFGCNLLYDRTGRHLFKVLRAAADDLIRS